MGILVWGVHMGRHHGTAPIDKNYVAIGWHEMGDLREIPNNKEAFKAKYQQTFPNHKPGAIPVCAGVLFRFLHEMQIGDIVVYPSKEDRHVNIGTISGEYRFNPKATAEEGAEGYEESHLRSVEWKASLPRTDFSQAALNTIGSALTLFKVENNADEFLAAIRGESPSSGITEESKDIDENVAEQVTESTKDFVIRQLHRNLSGYSFEEFVAHLLETMGYHARVTAKSGDGGIDIIAHKDKLGFEPPVIKVQCKRKTDTVGRPEVQQLMGAVEQQEFGLFVTLGSYSREALDAERNRPNLRLLDGNMLTDLIFEHYDQFAPQWKSVIPLERKFVPGSVD